MTHTHRCTFCLSTFAHDDSAYDIVIQHMCPQCGHGPFWEIDDAPSADDAARRAELREQRICVATLLVSALVVVVVLLFSILALSSS